MSIEKLPPGKNPPDDVYVVIEIPMGGYVKYELDKDTGLLFVDRILFTSMYYPFNYGFIPNTLEEDGDPVDVLVLGYEPVAPGSVIRVRPIGVLEMEDEEGEDAKVVAVPHSKVDARFDNIKDVSDLPQAVLDKVKHFFEHYKELEKGKWVKVKDWKSVEEAKKRIMKAIERFKEKH